ncbi:MAG: hypothetical protein V8T45_11015 [Oscillospiraceae bacterium]
MKKILSIMLAVLLFCSIVPVGYADGISDNGTEKARMRRLFRPGLKKPTGFIETTTE